MIALGSDHAGYRLKNEIIDHLNAKRIAYKDYGTHNGERCDSADIARDPLRAVQSGEAKQAILICGTGIGMSIIANKHKGIRAAVCTNVFAARHTRLHNNANTMCLGARVTGTGLALELVDVFLGTGFLGGRYQQRLDKLQAIEDSERNNA